MENSSAAAKVSVIIPCYNHGQYVEEAINSALSQTHKNVEVIVVNDGSTDELTFQKLAELTKKYPQVTFIHTKNQGLPTARNIGIIASSGDYILPLDADDKIAPEYLLKTLAEFERRADEHVGVVTTDALLFGDYEQHWRLKEFSAIRQLAIQQLLATSLISRSAFESVKKINGFGYNPNMTKGYEDWDFWLTIIDAGWKIVHIPETLFFYRKHGVSMVDGVKKNHKQNFLQLIENHKQNYDKNYPQAITILQEELNHAHARISAIEQQSRSIRWLTKRVISLILGRQF